MKKHSNTHLSKSMFALSLLCATNTEPSKEINSLILIVSVVLTAILMIPFLARQDDRSKQYPHRNVSGISCAVAGSLRDGPRGTLTNNAGRQNLRHLSPN